jgi:DNA-binding NarL/FixJ family response regulator
VTVTAYAYGDRCETAAKLAGLGHPHMAQHTVFLLASDHLGWIGLRTTLQSIAGVRLAGEASNPADARDAIARLRPELVLMSTALAGSSTLPLLAELRALSPNSQVLVLAEEFSDRELLALAELGAAALILWHDLTPAAVRICLEAVVTARLRVASAAALDALLAAARRRPARPGIALDERSRAILQRLAEGSSRAEIADAEHLSLRTVTERSSA